MNEWQRIKLKDICREITVGFVGPMAKEYTERGIPFLRSQNILPFRLDLSSVKYISSEFHRKLSKSDISSFIIISGSIRPLITGLLLKCIQQIHRLVHSKTRNTKEGKGGE